MKAPKPMSIEEIKKEIASSYNRVMAEEFAKRLSTSVEKVSEQTGLHKSTILDYAIKGTEME